MVFIIKYDKIKNKRILGDVRFQEELEKSNRSVACYGSIYYDECVDNSYLSDGEKYNHLERFGIVSNVTKNKKGVYSCKLSSLVSHLSKIYLENKEII
ncbi:hypothetical protein AYI69_g5320 [Smittium culicis]|uniref:Uncharacterized protein n=1 Tax=Smittium culicis TaxID=133412 RepID=A0A1R1Y714_9FUNG|nr:hypothetical protein AYI69_g5320 [Smittium culicis]